MSLLFYIDEKNRTLLRPDCTKLCAELQGLKEQEILFIILAYDNYSPYRQFPEHDRIRKAMFHAFDDNMPNLLSNMSIKLAIEAYKGLQYDPKIELAKKYQAKIDVLADGLVDDNSPTSIEKTTKAIDSLRKSIQGLEQEVSANVLDKGIIKGDIELSFLEEMMQNEKYYKSVIAPKK